MKNKQNLWIQISSGKGPSECERACFLFFQALKEFSQKERIKISTLAFTFGEEKNTIKSIFLSLEDLSLKHFEQLKALEGSLQWVSKSPFRKKHKRKNWFFKLELFNLQENTLKLDTKDIQIKATKASGAGGQHVNKTNSAVQILHVPTGIHFKVKEERSQAMNKKLALAKLQKALLALDNQKNQSQEEERWLSHHALERGNPKKVFKGENFIL